MNIIDNLYYYINTKRLKEQGHNLTTLGHALSNITEPFSVKASLHHFTVMNYQKVLFLLMDQALDIKFYIWH